MDGQGNYECWPNKTLLFIFSTRFKSFCMKWKAGLFDKYVNARYLAWADGILIQAVVDNLNLKVHITEAHPNFAEFTVVKVATP